MNLENPKIYSLLIIDDDERITRRIKSFLNKSKWEIDVAHSFNESLEFVKNAKTPYSHALIDVYIPMEGRGTGEYALGFKLAETIKRISPETKIIGMSFGEYELDICRRSGLYFNVRRKSDLIYHSNSIEKCLIKKKNND